MDLLTFVLWYLSIPTVAIFVGGMVYKVMRYALMARILVPKPEFRWREIAIRKGSFWDIGFWHWIKELIAVFLRPIIWSLRVNVLDFVGGLLMLHILGVILILFLVGTHVGIWFNYVPYLKLGIIDLTPLILLIEKIWFFLCLAVKYSTKVVALSPWSIIVIAGNAYVLALCVLAAIAYKFVDHLIKVKRGIINIRPGDFAALLLLLAVVLTGFLTAFSPITTPIPVQRLLLGLHVLFGEIFFMTLPFTKFSHFLFGYWYGKIHELYDAYAKRGV
ncbi:MAG: hypothetical protein GXO26_02425 [Crenarchaeota archaeon]|nr:hypothetical protein [Thermoproteota archaeon]